jgi:hypothetical protein
MRSYKIVVIIAACFLAACSQKTPNPAVGFPQKPVEIVFAKDAIHHLFPVIKDKSIGIVYGHRWSIGTIRGYHIKLDNFPEKYINFTTAKAIPQSDNNRIYIKTNRSIYTLDWKSKKITSNFEDNTRGIKIYIEKSKKVKSDDRLIISLFEYFDEDGNPHYQFVLDDIFNKKRLKELPIPPHLSPLAVFFTPSYIFYYYRTVDSISPWMALDNNLDTISHPLVSLLNSSFMDSFFFIGHENMLVSEEQQHALILAKNRQTKQEAMYLAQWHDKSEIHKIPFDTAIIAGERSLLSDCSLNTMSPSGKWCFFKVDGYRQGIPDGYFLIYLDPAISTGASQPIRLNDIDNIEYASWMTNPEGLVLYGKGKFLYYDLSKVDAGSFFGG